MKLITALATPFLKGKVDFDSYRRLLETQNHADELLVLGTTAENALLTEREKHHLIEETKICTSKKIWVGICSGATAQAVCEAKRAKDQGADGLLITPPSFFKCTEEGFVRHVGAIQEASKLQIMLYNAPSRCGYTLWQSALTRLFAMGVKYIKDAGSDPTYTADIPMCTYCGNEEKLCEFVQNGAKGVVSVVSNAFPELTKCVMEIFADSNRSNNVIDCANNQFEDVSENAAKVKLFQQAAKLAFCELNPISIKYTLYRLGIFDSYEVRLPLTSANEQTQRKIEELLKI